MVDVPVYLELGFVFLVLLLGVLLLAGLARGTRRLGQSPETRRRTVGGGSLGLALWLAATGTAATMGVLQAFDPIPPKIVFAIVPALVGALLLGLSPTVKRLADAVSGRWVVALQSFRVLVEIILWRLAIHRALPEVMTWSGRNFDVLTGLTAPLIAYLCFTGGAPQRAWLLTLWNVAGLLLVTNVFLHGMLSAPTRFRVLLTEPPNVVIGQFPFVWLPAFVVPVAYFLHVVSLRQARDVLHGEGG